MIRFDIDLMLPVQYRPPRTANTPERRLVLAVYETALHELGLERTRGARYNAAWWFANDDEAWPLSFRNCCAQLGLNPEAVRNRLGVTALATSLRLVGHRPSIVAPSTRRHRRRAG